MKHGQITQLARSAGISTSHMADIIKKEKRPSPPLAAKLEGITGIDRRAWLYPDEFPNPLIRSDMPEVSNGN